MEYGRAMTQPERDFLERLRQGDHQAFTQMVRDNQDRVYSYLYRMLGNPYEAAEVSQEVFLAAFRFVSSYRGESSLTTWLLRIASNMFKNHVRHNARRRRSRETSFDDVFEHADYQPIGQRPENPEELVARNEVETAIGIALNGLSEEFREVLILRDMELMTYEEIQELTGVPEGTIKSRLHRARAQLGRLLGRYVDGGGDKG